VACYTLSFNYYLTSVSDIFAHTMSTFHGLYHDEPNTKAAIMTAPSLTPAVLSYTPPDPPLEEVTPGRDRALFADPAKASLLAQASEVEELTPYIGTELKGVQLSKLTAGQKDELALLVAEVCASVDEFDVFADRRRGASCSCVIKTLRLISSMSSRRTTEL
jgi:hypothetical protein